MIKILFVCTGNTCRSPMAQALLLQRLKSPAYRLNSGEVQVWSAGLFTRDGLPASPEAIAVMREEDIDISSHRSLLIRDKLVEAADLVLTMTINQREHLIDKYPNKSDSIYTFNEFTEDKSGEIMDPYGHGREAYRQSLVQIKLMVDRLSNKILVHYQP